MSPVQHQDHDGENGFPRVSGDEPWDENAGSHAGAFSPREWG